MIFWLVTWEILKKEAQKKFKFEWLGCEIQNKW